jgi:hypothetical protein
MKRSHRQELCGFKHRIPQRRRIAMDAQAAVATDTKGGVQDGFIRLGGIAGLLVTLIGAIVNLFLVGADAPGFDAPLDEVASYVALEADRVAAGSALRYAAQFLLIFLAVGLYRLVRGSEDGPHRSWALVGLLGAVWIAATGSVANAMEVVAVWQADALADQTQLAAAVWGMNIAAFIALLVPWATFILGFSMAGRASGALPAWMFGLGLLITTTGLIGATGSRSVMGGGFAEPVAITAFSLSGLWVLVSSILMLRRSWRA